MKDENGTIQTKCRVLIVHGFCEYHKIYYRLMDSLSQNGIESFMFDQRGSGDTSPGALRGITDEETTFKDLNHFIDMNLKECQQLGRKLFLFGHSMGGGIVLNYGCDGEFKDDIDGIICTGPLIELHPSSQPSWMVRKIAFLLAKCFPNHRIYTGLNIEGITSDKAYQDFIANDPKSTLIGSFRQIYDFLERGERLLADELRTRNFKTPVLIMHGAADGINDPNASKHLVDKKLTHHPDKTLKLYENARHSILSLETDEHFNKALRDMLEWLELHCKDTVT